MCRPEIIIEEEDSCKNDSFVPVLELEDLSHPMLALNFR